MLVNPPLWLLRRRYNFMSTHYGVNACLAQCLNSVFNVKMLVGAFNHLCDCKTSRNLREASFEALLATECGYISFVSADLTPAIESWTAQQQLITFTAKMLHSFWVSRSRVSRRRHENIPPKCAKKLCWTFIVECNNPDFYGHFFKTRSRSFMHELLYLGHPTEFRRQSLDAYLSVIALLSLYHVLSWSRSENI